MASWFCQQFITVFIIGKKKQKEKKTSRSIEIYTRSIVAAGAQIDHSYSLGDASMQLSDIYYVVRTV